MAAASIPVRKDGTRLVFTVKAVPNASKSTVVGILGDAIKVAVAAAPEKGKANKEICKVLARFFEVSPQSVEVVKGHGSPRKTVAIANLDESAFRAALAGL